MGLQRTHSHQFDPRTRSFTLGAVRPQWTFVSAETLQKGTERVPNPDYHPRITWQDGKFYTGDGPNAQECPEAEVPEYIRRVVAERALPTEAMHSTDPQTMRTCPVCEEPMASGDMEPHLVEHARRLTSDGPINPEHLIQPRRRPGRPRKHPRPEDAAALEG